MNIPTKKQLDNWELSAKCLAFLRSSPVESMEMIMEAATPYKAAVDQLEAGPGPTPATRRINILLMTAAIVHDILEKGMVYSEEKTHG
jgi:hypothetical protein